MDAAEQKRRRKVDCKPRHDDSEGMPEPRPQVAIELPVGRHGRRLKKFRAVDSARLRWLTLDETTRLLNACPPDLRALVQAGLADWLPRR